MSKIKVAQLNLATSELRNLDNSESDNIVGGHSYHFKFDFKPLDLDLDLDLGFLKSASWKNKIAVSWNKNSKKAYGFAWNKGKVKYNRHSRTNYRKVYQVHYH